MTKYNQVIAHNFLPENTQFYSYDFMGTLYGEQKNCLNKANIWWKRHCIVSGLAIKQSPILKKYKQIKCLNQST